MSKERARRRAEREALAAVERERRARAVRRRGRRRALVAPVGRFFERRTRALRRATVDASPLTRRRRLQDASLLTVLVLINALFWFLEPRWSLRWVALGVTVISWPLLTVMLFNRRPSR